MRKHVLHIALLCLLLMGALLFASCEQARSIVKSEIVNGELILTYSDGSVENLGVVVGEKGDQGETGATGATGETGPQGPQGEAATDENPQGLDFFPLPDGTYAVSAGKSFFLEEIVIPATYQGKAVTCIGSPSGVNASSTASGFCAAPNLRSITIPDSVTSIGACAFQSCTNLTSVTIPANMTGIGSYAFENCSSLTSVTIPNSVTSIGEYAFYNCSSLTSVTIGSGVTSIGSEAFYGCSKLVEVYNLSTLNITKGGYDNGYVGCYAKNIYTATAGGSKLFTDANGYQFYDGGTARYLMGYMGTDTELTLPADCNGNNYAIYQSAFYNCSSLTSVTVPDGVTDIGDNAFAGCSSLTSVTFENPDGWWYADSSAAASGTSISTDSLANTSTAATYLKSTYSYYHWKRG